MTHAAIPGTFDPVTRGHLDIIERVSAMVDTVSVLVSQNHAKTPWFDSDQRVEFARQALAHCPNVTVVADDGLVARWCADHDVDVIVKGVRGARDLDSESAQAAVNRELTGVDTVFLPASAAYSHVSSTVVKDIAIHGGDISTMVTPLVAAAVRERASKLC